MKGNPEAENESDPGFRKPVFQFSYNYGKKTKDGKYAVPDGVSEMEATSCSF